MILKIDWYGREVEVEFDGHYLDPEILNFAGESPQALTPRQAHYLLKQIKRRVEEMNAENKAR